MGSVCCGCNEQIHTEYRSPVEKKGQHDHSLGERAGPDPSLDRLLLLFWAHYIKDVPHLLCTGSLSVVTFYRKQRSDVASNILRRGIFANAKG